MVLLHCSFLLRSLFRHIHWCLLPSRSRCCHSGLQPLSPVLFWIINSPAQGSEWVLLSRHSTVPASHCPHFGSPSIWGDYIAAPFKPHPIHINTHTQLNACNPVQNLCHYEQLIVGQRDKMPSGYVLLPAFLYWRVAGLLWWSRPLAWLTSPQAASIFSGFPEQWLTLVLINASADSDTSLEPCSCHVKEASTLCCSRQRISTPSLTQRHTHAHTHTEEAKKTGTPDNSSVIDTSAVKFMIVFFVETLRMVVALDCIIYSGVSVIVSTSLYMHVYTIFSLILYSEQGKGQQVCENQAAIVDGHRKNEINREQSKRRNEEKDWHHSSASGALPRQQGEALISWRWQETQ